MSVLKKKGADIDEIQAGFDSEKKEEMIQRSNGGRTFPQIFIGDEHIGGCDDLLALDRAGKLDAKLAA
jgi:glutaredoxin 3